jgi:hypothetical protein
VTNKVVHLACDPWVWVPHAAAALKSKLLVEVNPIRLDPNDYEPVAGADISSRALGWAKRIALRLPQPGIVVVELHRLQLEGKTDRFPVEETVASQLKAMMGDAVHTPALYVSGVAAVDTLGHTTVYQEPREIAGILSITQSVDTTLPFIWSAFMPTRCSRVCGTLGNIIQTDPSQSNDSLRIQQQLNGAYQVVHELLRHRTNQSLAA